MKQKIISGMFILFMLIGCNKISPNSTYILADGREVCRVDATKVFFDNKIGYVQSYDRSKFAMEINRNWNNGGGIYFHPEDKLIICNDIDNNNGNCNNIITEIQLKCSWCLRLDNNYNQIDLGTDCLSAEKKQII